MGNFGEFEGIIETPNAVHVRHNLFDCSPWVIYKEKQEYFFHNYRENLLLNLQSHVLRRSFDVHSLSNASNLAMLESS